MNLLRRLQRFLSQPTVDPVAAGLYSACVTQSRQGGFYRDLQVPDTIDGRFDLLLLHVFLVMRRLGDEAELKQKLFDCMFADMDRNLREMGVGDMSVGKKIKPMLAAFYGRSQAYEKALGGGDAVLAEALHRNLCGTRPVAAEIMQHMVDYVRRAVAALGEQPLNHLLSGQIEFASL